MQFCAIAAHQGKQIVSRSERSIYKRDREDYWNCLVLKAISLIWGGPSAKYVQDERQRDEVM